MSDKFDVSIIIPVYNTEEYLEQCLESLLKQGLINYEIIIINDGSTDSCANIIKKYVRTYPFIKSFYQNNSGQGAARNLGIIESNGQYIYFMDSDDYLKENALNELFTKATRGSFEAVFFDGETFFDFPNKLNNLSRIGEFNYSRSKEYGIYETGEQLMCDQLSNNDFFVSPCLYLISSDILKRNNIKFIESIIHEDEIFTVHLMLKIKNSIHINEKYFIRRVRPNSTMTSLNDKKHFDGYYRVFLEFKKIHNEHYFLSHRNKRIFTKKIKEAYYFLADIIRENPKIKNYPSVKNIEKISKQYKYFGLSGYLYKYNNALYRKIISLKNRVT